MGNVAGSPNDPIFFNHHTMIDCLFERWLVLQVERQNTLNYPELPDQKKSAFAGHGPGDCLVPFIPLYTNNDMFKLSTEFGYTCPDLTLPESTTSPSPPQPSDGSQSTPDSSQQTPDGQGTTPPGQSTNGASHNHIESALFAMLVLAFSLIALYI